MRKSHPTARLPNRRHIITARTITQVSHLGRHLMLVQTAVARPCTELSKPDSMAQSPDTGHNGLETTAQCVVCKREDAANKLPHHRGTHVLLYADIPHDRCQQLLFI